jgi:hypothetical protein
MLKEEKLLTFQIFQPPSLKPTKPRTPKKLKLQIQITWVRAEKI